MPRAVGQRLTWETMQEQERWLSVEGIAAHLGVNHDTIYKWIGRKQMPTYMPDKLCRFHKNAIDAWVTHGLEYRPAGSHKDRE